MKTVIALLLTMASLTAFAQKYDGDVTDIYISWCEQGNVIQSGANGNVIAANCAAEGKICELNQRTSGKNVYYRATCEEAPVRYGRE